MAKISLNPLVCPQCGADSTKVHDVYYTENSEIVRNRKCRRCEHTFTTIQECEVPLDRSEWALKYASQGSVKHSRKVVKVERIKNGSLNR